MPAAKGETMIGIFWTWYRKMREKADANNEPVKALHYRILRAGSASEGVEFPEENPPVGWRRGYRSEGPK